METILDKRYCSKENIEKYIEDLYQQITYNAVFGVLDKVVGIGNSGLHVSTKLANKLMLPHESVQIGFYGEQKTPLEKPIVVKNIDYEQNGKHILLVDDIIDTGKTTRTFVQYFGTYTALATLFWNPKIKPAPHFYSQIKPTEWIVFPWDNPTK